MQPCAPRLAIVRHEVVQCRRLRYDPSLVVPPPRMSRPSGPLGSPDTGLRPRKPARARRATAGAVRPHAGSERQPPAALDELARGALGEIRHELGNFFHRLYYWIDRLEDSRAADGESAVRMLETTARTLEAFLTTTLEYLHPITLAPVPMSAADAVAGLRMRLPGCVDPAGDPSALRLTGTLRVDPALLPEVLAAGVERVIGPGQPSVPLRLDARTWGDGATRGVLLELRCVRPAPRGDAPPPAACALRWARAQRIALLHGGWLAERAANDGSPTIAIFLPHSE